jgi:hypothetical protein
MTPPPEPHPRQLRYSVRRQARLDAETFAKLEALAHTCRRKRAQILRHVMPWGLAYTTGSTVAPSIPDCPRLVHLLLDPELLQRVQDAAAAHGVSVAAWLRQAMRQVTPADFPAGWRAGEVASRSHDSGDDHRTCGFRSEEGTARTLETYMHTFERSAAEIPRQRVVQANVEDVPQHWHMAAVEPRPPDVRPGGSRVRGAHEHPRAP